MSVSRPALRLTPCECLRRVGVKWRTSRFCVGPSLWTKRAIASCPNLPLNLQVTIKQQLNNFWVVLLSHRTQISYTAALRAIQQLPDTKIQYSVQIPGRQEAHHLLFILLKHHTFKHFLEKVHILYKSNKQIKLCRWSAHMLMVLHLQTSCVYQSNQTALGRRAFADKEDDVFYYFSVAQITWDN